jgi:hypothetical protein
VIQTNLATRPFYNERLVRTILGIVGIVAIGLLLFDAAQILRLRTRNADVRAEAEAAESEAARLRAESRAISQSLNRQQLETVQVAATEANLLIDRRAFSWTDLFNRFEATLPAGVRIVAVQPQVDEQGRMLVAISVISRRVEDLDEFTEALQESGAFYNALTRQSAALEDGTLRADVQGYYITPSPDAGEPTARESDSAPSAPSTVAEAAR